VISSEELARQQSENEWLFAACVFTEEYTAVKECTWLEGKMFINEDLGRFWNEVKSGVSTVDAINNTGLIVEITKWITRVPDTQRAVEYGRGIADTFYLRNVLVAAMDIAKAVKDHDIPKIQSVLQSTQEMRSDSSRGIYTPSDMSDEFIKAITSPTGATIKTHLPGLDPLLGGLFPAELSFIAGRPGTGKTALALQLARQVARSGKRVLFFSLEMSRIQLWARMACGVMGIAWRDVRSGDVTKEQIDLITKASLKLVEVYGDRLMVQDEVWNVHEMRQIAARFSPNLVIVDHLGEIHWHEPGEKESVWYGRATTYLRRHIARSIPDCHLVILHQLNRGVEARQDKRPILSDLRWDGSLEQLADIVMMTYRDDYYNTEGIDMSKISVVPFELWIRKFRQGPMNSLVMMNYDLKRQWFFSYTNGPTPQSPLGTERREIKHHLSDD
jgi:replicative DNA helicase